MMRKLLTLLGGHSLARRSVENGQKTANCRNQWCARLVSSTTLHNSEGATWLVTEARDDRSFHTHAGDPLLLDHRRSEDPLLLTKDAIAKQLGELRIAARMGRELEKP